MTLIELLVVIDAWAGRHMEEILGERQRHLETQRLVAPATLSDR